MMKKIIVFIVLVCFSALLFIPPFASKRTHDKKQAEFAARHDYLLVIIKALDSSSSIQNEQDRKIYLADASSFNSLSSQNLWSKVLVIKNANYTDSSVSQDYQSIFASKPSRIREMQNLGFKIIIFTDGSKEWKYLL